MIYLTSFFLPFPTISVNLEELDDREGKYEPIHEKDVKVFVSCTVRISKFTVKFTVNTLYDDGFVSCKQKENIIKAFIEDEL